MHSRVLAKQREKAVRRGASTGCCALSVAQIMSLFLLVRSASARETARVRRNRAQARSCCVNDDGGEKTCVERRTGAEQIKLAATPKIVSRSATDARGPSDVDQAARDRARAYVQLERGRVQRQPSTPHRDSRVHI